MKEQPLIIGSHVSLNGTQMLLGSVREAIAYGANALMVYTGAPQNTIRRPISQMKVEEAIAVMEEYQIDPANFIIHAPYIINPATSDLAKRDFCISFLSQEVLRTAEMGAKVIVLHPGNYLSNTVEEAIDNIAFVLNAVIEKTTQYDVVIALETMSGKGTEVGRTFQELKAIIDQVHCKERIGVCLDTCHVHDAGYDIIYAYQDVKQQFQTIIGFHYLKVIHVNDSKNPKAAHKDRHENFGKGYIGEDTLLRVCYDEDFVTIPKILETPYIEGNPPYKEEIAFIRSHKNKL